MRNGVAGKPRRVSATCGSGSRTSARRSWLCEPFQCGTRQLSDVSYIAVLSRAELIGDAAVFRNRTFAVASLFELGAGVVAVPGTLTDRCVGILCDGEEVLRGGSMLAPTSVRPRQLGVRHAALHRAGAGDRHCLAEGRFLLRRVLEDA